MTEEQIKEMYLGIINNGEKWERKANYSDDCEWQLYKLGEGIHEDWEYRKVEKKTWLEEQIEKEHSEFDSYTRIVYKASASEVCKKIMEELPKYLSESLYCEVVGNLRLVFKDLGIEL